MNKEQQIDKIYDIISEYDDCEYMGMATAVYNAGYRKMDEVTLKLDLGDRTPEEIKQIAEMFNGETKKQVAREILNTLNRTPHEYHEKKIKELAKFYGVETEE